MELAIIFGCVRQSHLANYIVEVKGARSSTEGEYRLALSSEASTDRGSAPDGITADMSTNLAAAADPVPYSIAVTAPGTLQVKTTGMIDTVGVLYGPDGRQIATDDDSGDGMNFLITEYVEAGQHIVTVEGQTRTTTGNYTLVVNFIEVLMLSRRLGLGPELVPGTGEWNGP